jgi:predicted GTPase
MFSPPVTTPCTIQCVLVGNTSSGKTTTTNALFAQPLSATSRQRNTLRPRVYVESSAPDDPATISQRNAAADAITADNPTAITPIEHAIAPVHDLDLPVPLRIVDVPGLDDGEQSAQYEAFLNRVAPDVQVYLVVVDINDAFNTKGSRDLLSTVTNLVACCSAEGPVRLLVLVNKCDDMTLGANGQLSFEDPELAEMYQQVQDVVEKACAGIRDLAYRVTPFSAADAYVYRMMHFNKGVALESKDIQRIGLQELGKREWNAMSEQTQREWFHNGLQAADYEQRMRQCGFAQAMQAFRDLVGPAEIRQWATAHVEAQVTKMQASVGSLEDVEFVSNRLEVMEKLFFTPLTNLYTWYRELLEKTDAPPEMNAETMVAGLSWVWLVQRFGVAGKLDGLQDAESLLGRSAEWIGFVCDVHTAIAKTDALVPQFRACPFVVTTLYKLRAHFVTALIERYHATIETHAWVLPVTDEVLVEVLLNSARTLETLSPDDAYVLNVPFRRLMDTTFGSDFPTQVAGQPMVRIWNGLAELGVEKLILMQWAKAYLLQKDAYAQLAVTGREASGRDASCRDASYHWTLEVHLGHVDAPADPDLRAFLRALEVRTKYLNAKCGATVELAPGDTAELVELECLLTLHAQQQEAERLANAPPPRRSSRRRKRAAQTNESDDEDARVGPATRRARC